MLGCYLIVDGDGSGKIKKEFLLNNQVADLPYILITREKL
jgi:hypothetical protein